jgi:RNA polymerase sporulation-specific sigma factor
MLCALRLDQPGSFPKPLSQEEERRYLERAAAGDRAARNILIERNLRLVAHIMKKYYSQAADQEDLLSIGTIGLIKGIETFDVSKGARLATYAARCVENEILMYFRGQRKTAGELSLSDTIETGKDGTSLSVQDVVADQADGLGDFKAIIRAFCKLYISIIPMTHYHRDDFVYLYT